MKQWIVWSGKREDLYPYFCVDGAGDSNDDGAGGHFGAVEHHGGGQFAG